MFNFGSPCFPCLRRRAGAPSPAPPAVSFPFFTRFPVELQLAIWAFAAALDPQPEVCLVWPQDSDCNPRKPYVPSLPLLVDTAWPAVAHVCRAARDAALTSGAVQLRYSPTARCAVPYRRFIPAIDTLYVTRLQTFEMLTFLLENERGEISRALRHLAVEMSGAGTFYGRVGTFIKRRASNLHTLSVVFPGTMDLRSSAVQFAMPERRCRLQDVPDAALDQHMLLEEFSPVQRETTSMSFREFLEKHRISLNAYAHHVPHLDALCEDGRAWSAKNGGSFSGLEIKAQTFVEYSRAEDGREQWVEVCRDRLLSYEGYERPFPPSAPLGERKNPEEYRVLDDDRGWHLNESYRFTEVMSQAMRSGVGSLRG